MPGRLKRIEELGAAARARMIACEHEWLMHTIPVIDGTRVLYHKPGRTVCTKCGIDKPVEQFVTFTACPNCARLQAELADLKSAAGLLPPQWEDLDRTINLLPRYHQSVNDQGTPGQPMVRLRDVLLLVRKQLVAPGRSPKETP